jgi:phosphopentomutase
MAEVSPGKDSVTGHWELTGVTLDRPFPVHPDGFPASAIAELERRIGRPTLGNVAASGTEIIERLGVEHLERRAPIVYTSADSVCQIAAHESVASVDELYRYCKVAFDVMADGLGVGRIIARPFVGTPGSFRRTRERRDFARAAPGETLFDLATANGVPVTTIGKIDDLFAGRGIGRAIHTASDDDGMDTLERTLSEVPDGLLMANLVDFDTVYGHRNDVSGYAANLERFDARLARLLPRVKPEDLLVVTADHGNDPTTPSTDHSREYVPVLLAGASVQAAVDLGTRASFADLGQTLSEGLGLPPLGSGVSFLSDIAAWGG